MKTNSLFKNAGVKLNIAIIIAGSLILYSCNRQQLNEKFGEDYYVAAYIWPSCHHDERFGDMLWPDEIWLQSPGSGQTGDQRRI